MKVSWLIDADMFERYREQLVAVIHDLGHAAKTIQAPKPGYSWDDEGCSYRRTFAQDACVVVHGDIDLSTRIHREGRWTPGAFGTVNNFKCSHYYCHFGQYLLNNDYIMLPFAELERCSDFLFNALGVDDTLFIRPDSPLKIFTGQTATRTTLDADLELMGFYDFPRHSLVVVSSPKKIVAEWRFVVADRHVVAGSEYARDSTFDPKPDYERNAHDLAVKIAAAGYQPDPVWVIDICQTASGSYHILEIGAFSFADLYATDKRAVVSAVSAVAGRLWRQQRDE